MTVAPGSVLFVGADAEAAQSGAALLASDGHAARHVTSAGEAIAALVEGPFDAVIVDAADGAARGLALVREIGRRWPDVSVIVAAADAALTEQATRAGAADVVQRPFDPDELSFVIAKAVTAAERAEVTGAASKGALIGASSAMKRVDDLIGRAAAGSATVLVRGESGTGKELVARALHDRSARAAGPFVKLHAAALPDTLLESELFGYEKGAFTGASSRKIGRVELAQGGTLFLDEIGDVTPAIQVKLLRLLQDREFERLGSNRPITADVRFVAATHRDLETMIEQGSFRQDLFYRLNVVPLWLPPLRARRDDITLLATAFCRAFGADNGRPGVELSPDALAALRAHRWPGNVRQLENLIERLVVLVEGPSITAADVEAELARGTPFRTQGTGGTAASRSSAGTTSVVGPLDVEVRAAERRVLEKALTKARGNRTLAAKLLGVSRRTLYYKLEDHGLG